MSWLERPQQKSSNPATKFLQWKSEYKIFSYYDKSTEENVIQIKVMLRNGYSQYKIANKFNVSRSCILKIHLGKTWKHI